MKLNDLNRILDLAGQPLLEARRNPEKNPHIGAWDLFFKYKDDPNVYISFTTIDKLGINPNSKFNTPNGIYTYPIKEFYENYIHGYLKDIDNPLVFKKE